MLPCSQTLVVAAISWTWISAWIEFAAGRSPASTFCVISSNWATHCSASFLAAAFCNVTSICFRFLHPKKCNVMETTDGCTEMCFYRLCGHKLLICNFPVFSIIFGNLKTRYNEIAVVALDTRKNALHGWNLGKRVDETNIPLPQRNRGYLYFVFVWTSFGTAGLAPAPSAYSAWASGVKDWGEVAGLCGCLVMRSGCFGFWPAGTDGTRKLFGTVRPENFFGGSGFVYIN